jgi:hypothetical protein
LRGLWKDVAKITRFNVGAFSTEGHMRFVEIPRRILRENKPSWACVSSETLAKIQVQIGDEEEK